MGSEIQLTEWENTFCASLCARQPGMVVQSLEEQRVIWSLVKIAQHMALSGWGCRDVRVWSSISQYEISTRDPDKIAQFDRCSLPEMLVTFLKETRARKEDGADVPKEGILVLTDLDVILEMDPVESRRALREALFEISERKLRKTVVIVGKPFTIPEEIAADVRIVTFELPTVAEIREMISEIAADLAQQKSHSHIRPTAEQIGSFARACGGLTESEARALVRLSLAKYEALDDRSVDLAIKEKAAIVRRGGALDVIESDHGIDDVGGLDNLKAYLEVVGGMIKDPDAAKAFGLELPSGFLFTGVPGCGKSYMCEAIAKYWNLPLLRFDVGRAFGGIVGETEANIRKMIATAEAIKPCVLMIDELEKGLSSGGERDGGTSERVKQSLLSWLNDKSDQICVIATANDLAKLESMPELIRAGRFDAVFFVDLPDFRSRLEILQIHLKKTGHSMPLEALTEAATASKGYSGAEIKVAVQSALRKAFVANPRPKEPSVEMLVEAIEEMVPLSKSMAEPIARLRKWCAEGRARPAGATLDSDEQDTKTFEDHGLPILFNQPKKK